MATRTISTRLAIEGEAEYKRAIKACNDELKTMRSGLSLTENEFRNNANSMAALTAKGEGLSQIYDKQKEKIDTLENALANAKTIQEAYGNKVAEAKKHIGEQEKALEDLKNTTGDTTEEQKKANEELEKWKEELEKAEAGQEAAEKAVNSWQRQVNTAQKDLNKLSDQIDQNNAYLEEAKNSTDKCATSIDQYGKTVKKAEENSEEFGKNSKEAVETLSQALVAAGVAATVKEITEVLMECVEASHEFEIGMQKIATLVDKEKISLKQMAAELMELSNRTGQTVFGLQEATYQAISASVAAEDAVEFVEKANKLAVGGFTAQETAVDVLTTALNAYNMEASETSRISDVLVTTQNKGKTTVDALAQSVGKVIPLAAAYEMNIENLGTAYAQLTANGIATAESGTYLKAMLNELGNTGSNVAKILEQKTGKSFSQLMKTGYSLGDVLDIIGKSVNNDKTAFNNLWSSSEAGVGALSLLNSGADAFNETLTLMEQSAGATEAAYEEMTNTAEYAQQRFENSANNVKIAIGQQLQPAIQELHETGADAFDRTYDFIEQNPWLISAITGLVTALGALAAGVAGLMIIQKIIPLIQTFNATLALNPALAVAAAITGLVVAIGSIAASAEDANEDVKTLSENLEESAEAYKKTKGEIKDNAANTKAYAEALKEAMKAENKTEAQKAKIKALVETLNKSVPELALAYDEETDSLNMATLAMDGMIDKAIQQEEAAAAAERMAEVEAELASVTTALEEKTQGLSDAQERQKQAVKDAVALYGGTSAALTAATVETNGYRDAVNELTEKQKALEAELAELEGGYGEYITAQNNAAAAQEGAAEKMAGMQEKVTDLVTDIEGLITVYNDAAAAARESIDKQIGTFEEMDGSAKVSIDNLTENLHSQAKYLDEYADNVKLAMEKGVDMGLVQKLSDGSEESAQILASIVSGSAEEIEELNAELAKVEKGKENFASTVGEMEVEFSKKMLNIEKRAEDMARELDNAESTYRSGKNTIEGYIEGIYAMQRKLNEAMRKSAREAKAAYDAELDMHSPSRKMEKSGEYTIEGAILGAKKRENDLKVAHAHLAEAAYSAYDTAQRSQPKIIEEPATISSQLTAAVRALTRGKEGSPQNPAEGRERPIYLTNYNILDGKIIGKSTTKQVTRNITRQQADRAAAMGGNEVVYGSL